MAELAPTGGEAEASEAEAWKAAVSKQDELIFDTTDKVAVGRPSREWTAVGESEVKCVREMAPCLGLIVAGRVPT